MNKVRFWRVLIIGAFLSGCCPLVYCQGTDGAARETEGLSGEDSRLFAESKRRNPFLTEEEERALSRDAKEIIDYLEVSGIFYSGKSSYAIIDGRIMKEKDFIDNKEITRIGREEVVLRDSGNNEYIVKIRKVIAQ